MSNSDLGVSIEQGTPSDTLSGVDIEQNDVGRMDNTGIFLSGPTIVEKLVGNTIHDVTTNTFSVDFDACGIVLQTNGTPAMPTVRFARDNTILEMMSG